MELLKAFGPEIWIAEGAVINGGLGFRYPTRMAIIRLADNALLVWSPVALSDDLRQAVNNLGRVSHIVAPNSLHDRYIADWIAAYPSAQAFVPPKLQEKRPDLAAKALTGTWPSMVGGEEITIEPVRGNAITTEFVLFHHRSGTVLFTDLLQQFPKDWFSGWRRLVATLDLMTEVQPTVPRKFRLAFTDRKVARASVARIQAWPCERLLMAHGTPVTANAHEILSRACAWLMSV
jgi:hypothetical protein